MEKNYKQSLSHIKAFVFDVDGVLTNNQVLILESGQLARSVSIRDGFALKTAVDKGFHVGIISGGNYDPVAERFQALGIQEIHLGIKNKVAVFQEFMQRKGIAAADVIYMGDDLPDREVMQASGLPVCPHDAVDEIRGICQYVSHKKGGEGCVRDVIQQTLKVQGKWPGN